MTTEKIAEQSKALTELQAIILTGFTGFMCVPSFSIFHADVEKRLGRSVWTHEFGSQEMSDHLKEVYRDDFNGLIPRTS